MSDSITVRQRIVRDISIDSGQPYAEASRRVPVFADRPGRPERIVIVGGGFAGFTPRARFPVRLTAADGCGGMAPIRSRSS